MSVRQPGVPQDCRESPLEVQGRGARRTLWTDFTSIGPEALDVKIRKAGGVRGLADYRVIWQPTENDGDHLRRRLHPQDAIAAHNISRNFIEKTLKSPFPGKSIVVSHHAPHPGSLSARFGGELDYCFASNLEEILLAEHAPAAWLHGHVHHSLDYVVGKCRVLCNPRGYPFLDDYEGRDFNPGLVIDTNDVA